MDKGRITMEENKKFTIPERSIQTTMLIAKLREHKEGDIVPYKDLNEYIKEDVQKEAYSYLRSARNAVLIEDGARWETILNVGIKRLNPSEALCASKNLPRKIQRTIRREKKKVQKIDFSRLDKEDRNSWNLLSTYASLVSYISKKKTQNVLNEKIRTNNAELPPGMAIDTFKSFK